MNIAIAGAFGFVGRNLMAKLCQDSRVKIFALTRAPSEDTPQLQLFEKDFPSMTKDEKSRITVVHCDLFSLLDCENVLQEMDYAIYLVHSMLPTSRLMQANFADMDLILADNFARAAKKADIKKIIYLVIIYLSY